MGADAVDASEERLLAQLRALASPVRLRILQTLVVPVGSAEIRVPAAGERAGLAAGRFLGRSTVIEHLDALEKAGFVRRLGEAFVVDQQGVVAFLQAVGGLARLRATVDVDVERTFVVTPAASLPTIGRPRLVIVDGPEAGRAVSLEDAGPWRVGRDAACEVPLGHDPHVSRVHATLRKEVGSFVLEVSQTAKNPVLVDFARLRAGERAGLSCGSLLAVGATRLVLQV